jgi:hypothetical protein
MVTDIGIELGKAMYWNRTPGLPPVRADGRDLRLLSMLVVAFFFGGAVGAVAYPHFGFLAILPCALALGVLTILPIAVDLRSS